jgi:hypothetical protein
LVSWRMKRRSHSDGHLGWHLKLCVGNSTAPEA